MNKIPEKNHAPEQPEQPEQGVNAYIGESIVIVGNISGKEDVIINCSVEGDINFREHDVIIGENGRIKANIAAKNIVVAGDVKGTLHASKQITIKPSGRVTGNIHTPRIALNDGCQFKGEVNMDETSASIEKNRNSKFRLSGMPPARTHPIKPAKKAEQP